MSSLGFIILRHVSAPSHDQLWQECYRCIRKYYPDNKIVIIDDASDEQHLTTDLMLHNTEILQSEYPKRGELLPYHYYVRNRWFDKAVILHDSVFIKRYINFDNTTHYKPLWVFGHDWDQPTDVIAPFFKVLKNQDELLARYAKTKMWRGAFGVMNVITHDYLVYLENRYKLSNLLTIVKTRSDRMILERVMAVVTQLKYPLLPASATERVIEKIPFLMSLIDNSLRSFCEYAHTLNSTTLIFFYLVFKGVYSVLLLCVRVPEYIRSRVLTKKGVSCDGSIHRQFLNFGDHWGYHPKKNHDKYSMLKMFAGR